MSYDSKQNGTANYNSWMHLNDTDMVEVTGQEGLDTVPFKERKYAQLTYQVNATPVEITGGLSATITSVGLNADGIVQLSGDQLKTFDQESADRLLNVQGSIDSLSGQLIQDNYSRVIQSRGSDTYIAHAPPGTLAATSGWRVQKLDTDGSKSWADTALFTQPADIELSGLVYAY